MSNDLVPDNDPTYGYQEGQIDNEQGYEEIAYPNNWNIPGPEEHFPETIGQQNPRLFYTDKLPHKPKISDKWGANTVAIGTDKMSFLLIGANPNRSRLTIWSDVAATNSGIYLSPNNSSGTGAASGSIVVPAIYQKLEMTHTGAVFVIGTGSGGNIYFIEESFA